MFILTCQLIQLACTLMVFYQASKTIKGLQKQLADATEGESSAVQLAAQYATERDQYRSDLQHVCNLLAVNTKAPEGAQLSMVFSLAAAQCKTFQETAAAAQRVLDEADTVAQMFGRSWILLDAVPNAVKTANPVVAMAQAHVGEIAGAMQRRQQAEQTPPQGSGVGVHIAKKPGQKRVNVTRRTVNGKRETVAEAKARIARELRLGAKLGKRRG